jgi:protein ImuA
MDPVTSITAKQSRAEVVDSLRKLLPRMENLAPATATFGFGAEPLDGYLPQGGLAAGALHEVVPVAPADITAAIGFAAALLARAGSSSGACSDRQTGSHFAGTCARGARPGPLLLILSRRALTQGGRLSGHGLGRLGLDPGRVILVETHDERHALWAMEEALRSRAPAAVGGAIGKLDLKNSQRLQFAAGESGRPLVLLRRDDQASAATTRWRVGAAAAQRDAYGLIAQWRWHVWLERCRNGRVGEWVVEYDHASHRFSVAAGVADPALSRRTGAPRDAIPVARSGRS